MTQINRTPFRKVADIPAHLLTSDKLKWDSTGGGLVVLTTDGKRYAYLGPDGKIGSWWDSTDATLRPHGLSWEAAEALVNPPQPKTEEPFRPGLPPAELRAVCQEWEQAWPPYDKDPPSPCEFVGEKYRFLYQDRACTQRRTDMRGAILWHSGQEKFRPHKKTWAEVEALAAAKLYRTVGEVLKAGLFDVCSHWYVKGHSEERRLGIGQERMLGTSVYMRVVKDLLTSSSGHFSADDLIRPSRVTWEALEAELAAKKSVAPHPVPIGGWVMRIDGGYHGVPFGTKAQVVRICSNDNYDVRLPDGRLHTWAPEFCEPCDPPGVEIPKNNNLMTVEGAVAVVKEGCRQALQEERQRQAFEWANQPTYIVACPKGRRKYVKRYLSQRGYENVDTLPYKATDKAFYLSYVSNKTRDELVALAPDIQIIRASR